MSAGPVPVRLLVDAYWKARNVRAHHAFRHLEKDRRVALSPFGPGYRLDVDCIGHEISLDDTVAIKLAISGKVTILAFKPIGERVRIVNDKVFAVKQVENQRCRRHCEQPRLFVALTVEVLILSIQRNRKQTPGLPFEALLRAVTPHSRGAAAIQDIIERFINMALRLEALARLPRLPLYNAFSLSHLEMRRHSKRAVD